MMLRKLGYLPLLMVVWMAGSCSDSAGEPVDVPRERWSAEEAEAWYSAEPWPVGANFVPSTAINQLEMWQPETHDEATIDRELGWAADLGFNTMRVFLHDLLWKEDSGAFLERIDQFLRVADRHGIRVMLVLFDGVWNPFPVVGPQPEPTPHVHNSQWVQSPGAEILADLGRHDELEPYVKDVIRRFRSDPRVLAWDLFNEPDNANLVSYASIELPPEEKEPAAEALLRKAFTWARSIGPMQPITAGVWQGDWSNPEALSSINELMLTESDVVSFHSYGSPGKFVNWLPIWNSMGVRCFAPSIWRERLATRSKPSFLSMRKSASVRTTGAWSAGERRQSMSGFRGSRWTRRTPTRGFTIFFTPTERPTTPRRSTSYAS